MEDEEEPVTPFWLKHSSNTYRKRNHQSSSIFLNSTVFVVVLLISALLFMFFVVPSILNLTSRIFNPQLVKKSWGSLNLVLVFLAIICAFLSRDNNGGDNTTFDEDRRSNAVSSPSRSKNQWYGYADQTVNAYKSLNRLRSSSYPDLRIESPWTAGDGDGGSYRFYDDTRLMDNRFPDGDLLHRRRRNREFDVEDSSGMKNKHVDTLANREFDVEDSSDMKNIHVDTFANRQKETTPPPPQPQAPSPPSQFTPASNPPVTTVRPHSKRTYRALVRKEIEESELEEVKELKPLPSQTAPPPQPPLLPPPVFPQSEKKLGKSDKKRSGATKDIITIFNQQKRKKKQRQKSVENFDDIFSPESLSTPVSSSAFQNLFTSKKKKPMKVHTDTPPPPAPPPPPSKTTNQVAVAVSQSHTNTITKRKSSLPVKTNIFNTADDNNYTWHSSIPPPPPPPPFKMSDWKFVVKGDYVRINSHGSSGSDSPDMEDVGPSSNHSPTSPQPPISCPSPDVNSKADYFIARFRAGLKLEKINSFNDKKGIGLSKLGPEPSSNPDSYQDQV